MNNKYIEQAIRTDLKSYSKPLKRIGHLNLNVFFYLLNEIKKHTEDLDKIKKYLFYGKEDIDTIFKNDFGSVLHLKKSDIRIIHSLIGIITEAGELCNPLIDLIEGKKLDLVNILEEFGDSCWYKALGLHEIKKRKKSIDIDILKSNIKKLKSRYPDKFSESSAINRNVKKERKVLENVSIKQSSRKRSRS